MFEKYTSHLISMTDEYLYRYFKPYCMYNSIKFDGEQEKRCGAIGFNYEYKCCLENCPFIDRVKR